LPELETDEKNILRMYALGALGMVYFKRDNPESVYGRAYDTLLPCYWQTVTFIWDYALSSLTHALLDPDVMKKLAAKLTAGLRPGAVVVSSNFSLPGFVPSNVLRLESSWHNDPMYVYQIGPKHSG